jgi:hypothetical protein
MPEKHAKYGGSTAARTLQCPAWVRLSKTVHRGGSSAAADRGTVLHEAVMRMHTEKLKAEAFVGFTIRGMDYTVTREDAQKALMPAHAALRALIGPAKARFETWVEHARDVGGTADILAAYRDMGVCGDFKFGANKVTMKGNAQLRFYASAALKVRELPVKTKHVTLAIIQPGTYPVLRTEVVNVKRLVEFGVRLMQAVERAEDPNAQPVPGPECDYCPARQRACPALNPVVTSASQSSLSIALANLHKRI